jgi:hypothetical protein
MTKGPPHSNVRRPFGLKFTKQGLYLGPIIQRFQRFGAIDSKEGRMAQVLLASEELAKRLNPRGIRLVGKWRGEKKKYHFVCSKGHKWQATGSSTVVRGRGCPHCAKKKTSFQRLTTEEVKTRLALRGIIFSGRWRGGEKEYRFSCNKKHTWKTTGTNVVLKSRGCPECALKVRVKLSPPEVNRRLMLRGITLVGEWRGKKKRHHFNCSTGHDWHTLGKYPLRGNGCPKCAINRKLTSSEVNERLAKRDIKLMGEWQGINNKNRFVCSAGHEWEAEGGSVVNHGCGCPTCNGAGFTPLTTEEVNSRLLSRGICLVQEWSGADHANRFRCNLGHEWETTGSGVVSGYFSGCPECARLRRKNRLAFGC